MRKESFREAEGLSAGLDEVGMGCLAGPICVAVVAFPAGTEPMKGVTDSKKLSASKRLKLAPEIIRAASFVGVGWAHPQVINDRGVSEAWRRACLDALEGAPSFTCLNIDGNREIRGYEGRQITFVKGDSLVWQIGAASIVAKVLRDMDMVEMGAHYPQYRWEKNAGYGSADHQKGLILHGPNHYHRGKYLRNLYAKHSHELNGRWESWKKRWA